MTAADQALQVTDAATELVKMLRQLHNGDVMMVGDEYLAGQFGVTVWSPDFLTILSVLVERVEALRLLVASSNLDEDHIQEIDAALSEVMLAFSKNAFNNHWAQYGTSKISEANLRSIRGFATEARRISPYKLMSTLERDELISMIEELAGWLQTKQLSENDFIRQSLIEGLELMKTRLIRFSWFGHEYILQSLKETIEAYIALESGLVGNSNPDAEAVLHKLRGFILQAFRTAGGMKDFAETADWTLKVLGFLSIPQIGHTVISGLLP